MAGRLKQGNPSVTASTEIQSLQLLKPLPLWAQLNIAPYLFLLYPLATYAYLFRYDDWLHAEQANTFILFFSLIGTSVLAFLGTKWSIAYSARVSCVRAKSLKHATFIHVRPHRNHGSGEIVPIVKPAASSKLPVHFIYQRDKYLYDQKTHAFNKLAYPIDDGPTVETYQNARGLSASDVASTRTSYGKNVFAIPIPTFFELFGEHAVAPFFVFQIFCVGLWCLDEYWYYSLFTLFMLVVFECTVVFQRQRTLAEFRTMSIKPFTLNVFRENNWFEIQSDDLLPGDKVSITRSKEDSGTPCDMLLVKGSCIVNEAMLSGESTPLLKESVELRPKDEQIDVAGADRNSVLFGGTKILQANAPSNENNEGKKAETDDLNNGEQTPDGGCLAVVLKTGFGTSQGQLVRTMIFSTERVTANNLESFLFIGFLLIFAIAASAYVWVKGVENGRPKMKLLLDCVIILTSVVPPELPMELSLAVNTSLMALSKFAIFCTEPFRIPLAGRVDVCCFDKTGTITGEDLIVEGIAGVNQNDMMALTPVTSASLETTLCLASAHALVLLDEAGIVGDPMEKTTLEALGYTVTKGDAIGPAPPAQKKAPRRLALPPPKPGSKQPVAPQVPEETEEAAPQSPHKALIQIKRRFQFSSALKRMSTVSLAQSSPSAKRKILVSVKGAPETLKGMYKDVPSGYEQAYKAYAQKGSRVLALGYKWMDGTSESQISRLEREAVEGDLIFAGFLVFHCPLKPDARTTIRDLNDSSHRCIMITGDNPLTAVHVAREVEIVDRDVLILDLKEGATSETDLVWRTPDDAKIIPVDLSQKIPGDILQNYDLCMTGAALKQFGDKPAWKDLVQHVFVYARVAPAQKEMILQTLKDLGFITLMAGDGTNDVGALKRAHIGIALLNGSETDLKQIAENQKIERLKKVYESQLKITSRFNQAPPPVPAPIQHLYPDVVAAQKKAAETHAQSRAAQQAPQKFDMGGIMEKFQDMDEDDKPPIIKLGDASVAAPFTSKLANLAAVTSIIRQGRCTLVATTQMYKILALNCLISAYSLSVMYLDGIKFGDYQVTIQGMLMSVCFLCISRAKPLDKLSAQRPLGNIFNLYVLLTVLVQFSIHIIALVYITRLAESLEPRVETVDLEKEFKIGLLNSAIYLVSLVQQISTFAINFIGRPFREGITENSALYYGLLGAAAVAINGAIDFVPEFNRWLQLTEMSWNFRFTLLTVMVCDYAGAWLAEIVIRRIFASNPLSELITRGSDRRAQRRLLEPLEDKAVALNEKKTQ